MREKLAWIRHVPFRKLQLRVMLYLLVFGLVPIICTIYLFYQQSTSASRVELERLVNREQQFIVDQLKLEIMQLENRAVAINNDAEVQRMQKAVSLPYMTADGVLLSYLHTMIPKWRAGYIQSSDICFSFYVSNTSVCEDTSIIQLDQPLYNSKDHQINRFIGSDRDAELVRYVAPLNDLDSESILGHITMTIDLKSFLLELRILDYPSEIILTDSLGNPIFEFSDIQFNRKSKLYESVKLIDVLDEQWQLTTNVMNENEWLNRSNLMKLIIIFLLFMLVLSLVGAFIFSRILTRPLLYLRSLMKRAELGDLKAYWTYKSSQDIDELGESYNQMLNRLEDVIKQVKVEEALKKEKEFEALQYQLNPHFLYNTLNTIKWVAKIHKTPQISEVVSALVRLLQVSLNKKGDFVTIREEVGLVKDYMDIQTFRYGETIKIENHIDSIAAQCLVPKMILQPLVENAIIHGLDQSNKADKTIIIRAWIERDLLFCQVEDNGRGLTQEQMLILDSKTNKLDGIKERLSGIGIQHIREKIRLYYGPDYSMQIFSKPNQGTTIRLSLPIHQSEG